MVEHITNMIVINLDSEDNANDLETVQIRSVHDKGRLVRTSNESEKGTIDDNPNVHMVNTVGNLLQSKAIMMKN
jgi:hypothetical protein